MDPILNPYTPNAGAQPPAVLGRDVRLRTFDLLLRRMSAGRTEQSMIITGLRGVGKTVLLGRFRSKAHELGWVVVEREVSKYRTSVMSRLAGRPVAHSFLQPGCDKVNPFLGPLPEGHVPSVHGHEPRIGNAVRNLTAELWTNKDVRTPGNHEHWLSDLLKPVVGVVVAAGLGSRPEPIEVW
jgi:hypothetical protein